jgi:hypothetical protein
MLHFRPQLLGFMRSAVPRMGHLTPTELSLYSDRDRIGYANDTESYFGHPLLNLWFAREH